eukprot:12680172-Alexandrium_andersonii.AAC.1
MHVHAEVDLKITNALLKECAEPDRVLHQRIRCLGIWTANIMSHVDQHVPRCCEWCGALQEDWVHVFWRCPRFEAE